MILDGTREEFAVGTTEKEFGTLSSEFEGKLIPWNSLLRECCLEVRTLLGWLTSGMGTAE